MREDFLHFIWKHKKFNSNALHTTGGQKLEILGLGLHNHLGGPDFFDARLLIDGQFWAGNVEMHLKSSDWFAHGHEKDQNYDNVILHVVWEDDVDVFRKDGSIVPSLILKDLVDAQLLKEYNGLMLKKPFINCEKDFEQIDALTKAKWYERLFVERLEAKSKLIFDLLDQTNNDWEKVLFCLLMKSFGLNRNGEAFLHLAKQLDFSIFRKGCDNAFKSEALLMGLADLLEGNLDSYQAELQEEYSFLCTKYKLADHPVGPTPDFYGLRPHNFPTIRLSQLANLYASRGNLFFQLINNENISEIRKVFKVAASPYWNTHFVFGKTTSTERAKKVTPAFTELLLINTVIPLKFCYGKKMGKDTFSEIISMAETMRPESNSIIDGFDALGTATPSAFQSQAKIHLYKNYCHKNQCLKCAVGHKLLLQKV